MSTYQRHAQQLGQLLNSSDRVLLTTTTGLDGDSIGAIVATADALESMGKRWFAYVPEDVPAMFSYLTKRRPLMRELDDSLHSFSTVILFDTGDVKRVPIVSELVQRDPKRTVVVNIDHHATQIEHGGNKVVDLNIVDPQAAATTEMLVRLFSELKIPIHAKMATALLTGILTDTTHFSNPNTTPETISVAAQLMAKGADHRTITYATMRNKSMGTLKLWGLALSRLAYNPHSGIVSTVITLRDLEECGVTEEATEGIANFLNSLSEGKVALVLKEDVGGFVKGSFRTTSDVDVSVLAKKFGGGGHAKAAGFRIRGKLVETGLGWQVERPSRQSSFETERPARPA